MSASDSSMTPFERRASIGLASIYGLRMLGLFIILPIFALYAENLPGGESHFLIGVALGAYGLTQAILQIPAGWLSDRYGRKPIIIVGLLLFAAGSFIAASADDIYWIIAGRVIQGAGAINAAVMALTADLTREEHRTKAMAMIGMTIGVTFSLSMVLSPVLYKHVGMSGIFALTGVLAFVSIAMVLWFIPNPRITRFHTDTEANRKRFGGALAGLCCASTSASSGARDPDVGIHAGAVPAAVRRAGGGAALAYLSAGDAGGFCADAAADHQRGKEGQDETGVHAVDRVVGARAIHAAVCAT
jgi:MFS family permease